MFGLNFVGEALEFLSINFWDVFRADELILMRVDFAEADETEAVAALPGWPLGSLFSFNGFFPEVIERLYMVSRIPSPTPPFTVNYVSHPPTQVFKLRSSIFIWFSLRIYVANPIENKLNWVRAMPRAPPAIPIANELPIILWPKQRYCF